MQLKLLLYIFYILNIVFSFGTGVNLWKKYSKLSKKINKMLNKQQGSELLTDINEYEYPRANETLRNVHKELWREYYECLKKAYSEIGSERIIYPIALQVLEGTYVELKCRICISPIEVYMSDSIQWYFNNSTNIETSKLLEESDDIFISPEDQTLMMYNIKSQQAGQYWCKLGDTLSLSYYISIDTDLEGIKTVYPTTARNMPHATPQKIIPEYKLIVHTTWTKWSLCSKCNAVGKKVRYGYCTISLHENIQKKSIRIKRNQLEDFTWQKGDNQNETVEATSKDQIVDKSIIDKIKMVLHVFRNNVPCKSKYLPKEILDVPDIKNRKTEMMMRYCKVKCPQNVIFEIRDNKGNVIESANNSAGIYSMVQGMPVPSAPVIHTAVYQKYNKKAILVCPRNSHMDVPINWKVDGKIINPSILTDQSKGRVYINAQMHIIFTSLRFEDSNIYSCWQKKEIVGVIKLNVTGELELQTNYSVIMIGGILIIIVFMIVFWRAFQGRNRYTIH